MTGSAPPLTRAGRQERTEGRRGLLVGAELLGGGQGVGGGLWLGVLVLNLEQLIKGIVSQTHSSPLPISSLLLW